MKFSDKDSLPFLSIQLIYNVVLVSDVQHSDSFTHTCTFFFILLSITAYHTILNTGPCAIQQGPVIYLLYIYNLRMLTPNSPFIPSHSYLPPLWIQIQFLHAKFCSNLQSKLERAAVEEGMGREGCPNSQVLCVELPVCLDHLHRYFLSRTLKKISCKAQI